METAKDRLEKVNFVYYYSVNADDLKDAAAELAALMQESWLSEDNMRRAEMLLWRVQAKRLALIYFEEGYDGSDADAAIGFAVQKAKLSEERGYKKTALVLSRVASLIERVNEVMRDADVQACRVRTYTWEPASSSQSECRRVQEIFREKAGEIEKIGFPEHIFNSGVKFPDVKAELLYELKKVEDFADKCAFELECKENKDIIVGLRDLRETSDYKHFEFTAVIDKSERLPGTIFLCTPFVEEAQLLVIQNSASPIYEIDKSMLVGKSAAGLKRSFEIFEKYGATILIKGLNDYHGDNKKDLYLNAVEYGRSRHRVYIVDESGDHELYSEAVEHVGAADICFKYLTMPGFASLLEFLLERKMISKDAKDEKFVRENLIFMGYTGLNVAVREFVRGKDWRAAVAEYVRERAERASDYIKELPSQSQFVDSGWGDFSDRVRGVLGVKAEFNYDGISHVDAENIKKIMNATVTFFQRCGMLVAYCCGAGADKSEWDRVVIEEKKERVMLATRLLLRAMGVTTQGKVEFCERLSGGFVGLCCNAGQLIKYKIGLLDDFWETMRIVAHECMHAFQHQAVNDGWSAWMYDDLGVTYARVEEWALNFDHYFASPRKHYRNQVVESDAEAFAHDCVKASSQAWNTLDLR